MDVDDYWEPDSLEKLVDGLRADGGLADIVAGGALVCSTDGRQVDIINVPAISRSTGPSASRMLLKGELSGHVWNKLFRRSLLLKHPFPSLPTHQDLACLVELVESASQIRFIDNCGYHYIRRPESTLHSSGRSFGSLLDVAKRVEMNFANGFYLTATRRDVTFFWAIICVLECARDSARMAGNRRLESARIIRAQLRSIRSLYSFPQIWSIDRRKSIEFMSLVIAPSMYMNAYRLARTVWKRLDDRGSKHEHPEDVE